MKRLTLCLLAACTLWSAAVHAQSYTFTTLAGLAGFSGNVDGTGRDARFNRPYGIAVDGAGYIYVTDAFNHTIRKITPDGVVSTLAGLAGFWGNVDGPGRNARFNHPYGIAVDGAGYIYVADTDNHTIRKITPDGVVSTLAGQFNSPHGVAVDGTGYIYVTDFYHRTIHKITPAGVVSTLAGGKLFAAGHYDGTGTNAFFEGPSGIALDGAGNIYVADETTIRKITPDGVVSTLAGKHLRYGSADGTGTNAEFLDATGIAVGSAGNLYVAEGVGCTIRKVTPDGVVSTVAGLPGFGGRADGTGSDARFSYPYGIASDSTGNLYVADIFNHTIRLGRPASVTLPSLRFSLAADRLILSWPLSATNAVVETSSTLSPAVWTPLTNPVGISGDSFVVTNTPDSGARFYRLRTP